MTDGLKPDGQTTSVGGLPMSIRVSPHPIDFSGTLNNILLKGDIYRYGYIRSSREGDDDVVGGW